MAVLIIDIKKMPKEVIGVVTRSLCEAFGAVERVKFVCDGKEIAADQVGWPDSRTWYQHVKQIFEQRHIGSEAYSIFCKERRKGTWEDMEAETLKNPTFFNS